MARCPLSCHARFLATDRTTETPAEPFGTPIPGGTAAMTHEKENQP